MYLGIKSGESVLLTMKAAQVPETANTKFSILKGVSKRDSFDEFQNVLRKYPISLTDIQLLELVKVLGINDNISWLPKVN
ncbi:hypothetical protein NQ314_013449 [Rhamnusium bicolor]|uniref:Uncharacterized protein n=1 Tax=Rhamnusium bicolor TaxID=1586634 RepID=A0AAV8X610_9CUCU|nr:hypothetical protein NQ314_013449 [Rhamnusium bicolor]